MGRAARKTGEESEGDSDDGAPEEVTVSSGREEAHRLRMEERDNRRRLLAEAKQRRQKISGPKKNKVVSKQEASVEKLPERAEGDSAGGEHEEQMPRKHIQNEIEGQPLERAGLLDSSIVDFLVAQEKKGVEVDTNITQDIKLKKRKNLRQVGKDEGLLNRVKVVLLNGQPTTASFQSALEFRHNRLFGNHVERSLSMLPRLKS